MACAEETPSQLPTPQAAAAPKAGMVDAPCPPPKELPAALRDIGTAMVTPGHPAADYFKTLSRDALTALMQKQKDVEAEKVRDWPGACHYKAANAALQGHALRVVFMGDSITENWSVADPSMFDQDVVDRGISGQTTPQMLARFMQDVVDLHPRVVHIMAGTNDVAGNTGPNSPDDFKNNVRAMVELARANHIALVIGSILPSNAFPWQPKVRPASRIAELNIWLRGFAAQIHAEFVDYHSALKGADDELPAKFSNDGVHPNTTAYAIMRSLAEAAIGRAEFGRKPK
jgi:lysophospholipase L1-like esterase